MKPAKKQMQKPEAMPTPGLVLTPEIGEQLIYNIMNTPILEYPCPHFVTENVWPDDFFEQMRLYLPATEHYQGIMAAGRVVAANKDMDSQMIKDTRFLFSLENDLEKLSGDQYAFWKSVREFLFSPVFHSAVLTKFLPFIQQRFPRDVQSRLQLKPVAEMFRDLTNYSIGPHSDAPPRLLNLFFYLPEDDSKPHLGTSFYVPKDRTKKYVGGPHYPFDEFRRVFTAPYQRNVMAAFFKNDVSFHGVEPVKEKDFERNALAYFIRVFDTSGVPITN